MVTISSGLQEVEARQKVGSQDFRKANFGLFEGFPRDTLLETGGAGHLVDIQGSPSPSPRKIHLNQQEIKQKWEEPCMELNRILTKWKHKKEVYEGWNQDR